MFFKRRIRIITEIPSASMADIAFLLIVFFLTTTIFSGERGLQLIFPDSRAAAVQVTAEDILQILIHTDGSLSVRSGVDLKERDMELEDLSEFVRGEIGANPRLVAAVRVAPEAEYQAMIDVLDELRHAEAQRISLENLEG